MTSDEITALRALVAEFWLGDETDRAKDAAVFHDALPALLDAADECARLREAWAREGEEIQQVAGRALGYPRYADDQANFPGATGESVCVGEHVAVTIVQELAARHARLREVVEAANEWNEARGSLSVARSDHDGAHREISDGYARVHAAECAIIAALARLEKGAEDA